MTDTTEKKFSGRLLWAFAALCVLAASGFIMVNNLFQNLPPLFRVFALMYGWIVAMLLAMKSLPPREARIAAPEENLVFPSPALKTLMDAQEDLGLGFVALDSRARVVLSNTSLDRLLDVYEASAEGGLARTLHPGNAHVFSNTFHVVSQGRAEGTVLKLRSFDKAQQIHHLHVVLAPWRESPVAVVGIMRDISNAEQVKMESQTIKSALHDFQSVFASEGKTLLDTMRRLLEMGNLHFKAELGLIAKICDGAPNRLEVMQVVAPLEDLSRGQVFDPSAPSYPNFPRALAHASFVCKGEDATPPSVRKETEHDTFLGAPIYLHRKLYGVLCFASPESRAEEFSSSELELVQFMANWLGEEMARQRVIERFTEKQKELQDAAVNLEALLRNDLLTGIFNKNALDDLLKREFERARAYGLPLSLVALSPNHYEDYRNRYGEEAASLLLERFVNTIEEQLRDFDIAARYDESTFVVVYPHDNEVASKERAEKLQIAIAQMSNAHHNFTTSVGLVSLTPECTDSYQLLDQVVGACQLAQTYTEMYNEPVGSNDGEALPTEAA